MNLDNVYKYLESARPKGRTVLVCWSPMFSPGHMFYDVGTHTDEHGWRVSGCNGRLEPQQVHWWTNLETPAEAAPAPALMQEKLDRQRKAYSDLEAKYLALKNNTGNPEGNHGYMVVVEGGHNPRQLHPTMATADLEAERLVKKENKITSVLKIVARWVPQVTVTAVRNPESNGLHP